VTQYSVTHNLNMGRSIPVDYVGRTGSRDSRGWHEALPVWEGRKKGRELLAPLLFVFLVFVFLFGSVLAPPELELQHLPVHPGP